MKRGKSPPFLIEALEPRLLLTTLPSEAALSAYPLFSDLWHLQNTGQTLSTHPTGPATGTAGADIDATSAWDLTTGSKSVVIAVLDTGVDITHPDLADNIWTNPFSSPGADTTVNDGTGLPNDIHGWNFVDNNADVSDTIGHGTSVAGVIGAVGNNGIGIAGVAWHVSILPVKVGTISGVTDAALVAGINYIITLKQHGVDIVAINASYLSFSAPDVTQLNAIAAAGNAGILYINAAGNDATNLDPLLINPIIGNVLPSNVITVAATDNQDHLASFSNYGPQSVALAAPGVDITTTGPTNLLAPYIVVSGTSYAAPMVSGAVALLASYVPSASMAQLKAAILAGVDLVPGLSGIVSTGGRLNAYRSLEALIGNPAPIGSVDVVTGNLVQGWAFDANSGSAPVSVQIYINNVLYATVPANTGRPDLQNVVGSTQHGFNVALPAGTPFQSRTIAVYALNNPSGPSTLLGSGTAISAPVEFDESWYLLEYPDVAAAVRAGAFASGFAHYVAYGAREGRQASPYFDERYYLAANPDVAAAVRAGTFLSGFEHYVLYGQYEPTRNPSLFFNEQWYLAKNPDVAAAVSAGSLASGWAHYVIYGAHEGRDPSADFSESFYRSTYSDVAAAIVSGLVESGFEHYVTYGQFERRSPNAYFLESYYLGAYADVASAVDAGEFPSGYYHFLWYGSVENRRPSLLFNPIAYLARYPDVAAAIAAHAIRSAWDHYMMYGRFEGRLAT